MWTEKGFGMNDIFILIVIAVSWSLYFWMPKMYSRQVSVLIFLYSVTVAGIFDNSFGSKPFDFYDIMDGPAYTIMDVAVYFMYPPFGYFFLFLYQKLRVNVRYLLLFISIFTIISVGIEWFFYRMGVFHYKNGYSFIYSGCIYLVVQLLFIQFYHLVKKSPQPTN